MTQRLLALVACLFAFLVLDTRELRAAEGTVALQIKPLAMPAVTDKGYKGRMTMTPYVEVTDAKAVARLCGRLPRLLDAVLLAFEDNPVALSDPAGDMAKRQDALRTLTDETVGTGVFAAFYLVPGSVERGEGTEMIEVPGGARECQPIRELPWIVQETAAKQQRAVSAPDTMTSAMPSSGDAIAPSPLTEEQLLKAEAELNAEQPIRKPFPGAPPGVRSDKEMPVKLAIIVAGIGGLMMVIGSYIGYQVAKIRRERRRQERRKARRDRRTGADRRRRSDGPPPTGERRQGEDRRRGEDRRKAQDRRTKKDRRAESEEESGDEK